MNGKKKHIIVDYILDRLLVEYDPMDANNCVWESLPSGSSASTLLEDVYNEAYTFNTFEKAVYAMEYLVSAYMQRPEYEKKARYRNPMGVYTIKPIEVYSIVDIY